MSGKGNAGVSTPETKRNEKLNRMLTKPHAKPRKAYGISSHAAANTRAPVSGNSGLAKPHSDMNTV